MSLDIIFTDNGNNSQLDGLCGRTIALNTHSDSTDYYINITHNLNRMSENVPVKDTNLYRVLWHGDELDDPIVKGYQFEKYLYEGIDYMSKHRSALEIYSPSNVWGNYDSLLQFTKECLALAIQHPNADVRFST